MTTVTADRVEDGMSTSKGQLWTGRVLTGLSGAFLILDALMKFIKPEPVITAFHRLGWSPDTSGAIGAILLLCTIIYLIPRTAVLGAILLTGYLGGAVATNWRVQNPLFTHVLFPVYFGILIWGGLLLRARHLGRLLINLNGRMNRYFTDSGD